MSCVMTHLPGSERADSGVCGAADQEPCVRLSAQVGHRLGATGERYNVRAPAKRRVKISGSANQSVCIPVSHKHRLENPGKIDLVLSDAPCSACLGGADVVRPPGHYGRA